MKIALIACDRAGNNSQLVAFTTGFPPMIRASGIGSGGFNRSTSSFKSSGKKPTLINFTAGSLKTHKIMFTIVAAYTLLKKRAVLFVPLLQLASLALLIFLLLACIRPAKAFSGVYLVKSSDSSQNSSTVSAGYLYMCSTGNSTSCGNFKGNSTAKVVGDTIVRPYMCVLAIIFCGVAFVVNLVFICVAKIKPVAFIISGISLIFTLIAAIWQEVAVHAAVHLVSDVKKGYRASGMIWSALALLIVALVSQVFVQRKKQKEPEPEKQGKLWTSVGKPRSVESFETRV